MEKKKVLFYNGQLFMGGIERVATSYINELAKLDSIDLTVLIKENNPEKNIFVEQISKKVSLKFIKTEKMVSFRDKVAKKKKSIIWKIVYAYLLSYERYYMKKWLKSLNDEDKYDIIIDFDMSLGKYIQVLDGYKFGWIHYSLIGKKKQKNKSKRFEKRLEKYDKIITICDEMKDEAKKFYNIPNKKIERLYNPFNIEMIKTQDLSQLSLFDQKLLEKDYMVAVSRLVKVKGRMDLIEIYYNLKLKYKIKEKLYILGNGEQKEQLEEKIKELHLEEDILLLGEKINPYIWMKRAKVFLHTSYGEGLPTVFLKSMILGTPVIAYDCPTGPKDILGNNRYGILVECGNKTEFENAVVKFLNDSSLGIEFLNRFKKEKLDEFLSKNIISKLEYMFNEKRSYYENND